MENRQKPRAEARNLFQTQMAPQTAVPDEEYERRLSLRQALAQVST
jgi:hypothetical protein